MGVKLLPIEPFLPVEYTWSAKPLASRLNGVTIKITDIGTNGSLWISNGTRWTPLNGDVTLACSNASPSLTGTLSETALATYTIPGGLMSATSELEIVTLWTYTNSANTKTLRIRLGGIAGAIFYGAAPTTTASCQAFTIIRNAASTSSQIGMASGSSSGLGSSTISLSTGSRDITADQDLVFSGQLTNVGESISLIGYSILYRE